LTRTFDLRWAENFLCAGSSALLISAAHFYGDLWFFSLFALVPFLWRVIRAGLIESLVLGGLLAVSYLFVAIRVDSSTSIATCLLAFGSLIFLFAIYGLIVNRITKHLGFNAIFIAALWLPLEYYLSHDVNLGNLFVMTPDESGLLFRFGSLFGLLMVSFVFVIVNALILITVGQIAQALRSLHTRSRPDNNRSYASFQVLPWEQRWYCFPDVRAPPGRTSNDQSRPQ